MKQLILINLLIIICFTSNSQTLQFETSYKYLYSKQWDKAIHNYNFSRPFLNEQQPLLMNGLNLSTSYAFKSKRVLIHGISISYSYFQSKAQNNNLNNTLNLHFLNLGYILRIEKPFNLERLYTDFIISATSSGLFKKINNESYMIDDKKINAIGVGGDVGIKIGYNLSVKNSCKMSSFISVNYTPYLYSPKTESVINQTKGLIIKNWAGIVSAQIGISIHFLTKK